MFIFHLNENAFNKMKNGKKTIELRLYDIKRSMVYPGATIIFERLSEKKEQLLTEVTSLHRYQNFQDLFNDLSLSDCGFEEGISAEEACSMIHNFYSDEEIDECGVLGIRIKLHDTGLFFDFNTELTPYTDI